MRYLIVWFARELQPLLGYARWENFQVAISRVIDSCISQSINVDDHFCDLTKMIKVKKLNTIKNILKS